MALHIRQTDQQSELQKRIATELQDKAKKRTLDHDRPDGVDDSGYVQGMKQTTGLAWAWVLIGLVSVGIIVWLVVISATGV